MAARANAGVIGSLGEAGGRFISSQINAHAEVCSSARDTHPADARAGTGRVGRGRGKGGGVLLARVTALFLGEGTRRVKMELAPWCGAIYGIFDSVA